MIIEEINFLARHSFSLIADVNKYKENLENKLPELKGKRELLWRKHKSADTNKKDEIKKDINALTEKIDTIQAQKNACNRIIAKYIEIKNDCQKEQNSREMSKNLVNKFKNHNLYYLKKRKGLGFK